MVVSATSRPLDVAATTASEATLGSACPISSMVGPPYWSDEQRGLDGQVIKQLAAQARSSELIAVKPVLHEGGDPMWGERHASS
jgi:hypothetical protein